MPETSVVQFRLPGDPHQFTISSKEFPEASVALTRPVRKGVFFDVIWFSSFVIGFEGGDTEYWAYPFQALKSLRFFIRRGDGVLEALEDYAVDLTVTPYHTTTTFKIGNTKLTQRIIVSPPDAIYAFDVDTDEPITLVAKACTDLKLMWPADPHPQNPQTGLDGATGAWVVRATTSDDAVCFGWVGGRADEDSTSDGLGHTVQVQPGTSRQLFIASASVTGEASALGAYRDCATDTIRSCEALVDYYGELLRTSTSLVSSDPELDEAFLWAKIGLDKSYLSTPGLGSGFVAGYNHTNGGGRPGFGWYFGRDSSWTGFAVNDYGDFEKTADNIRLLAKYQILDGENKGKIYHELSAAHDRVAGMEYAFPAADSTPFFVVDIANYYRWTGDIDLVREMWPHVVRAMDWCYRMDVDGDMLVDNPPAGHQWYDGGEKNMIDMVAIWAKGLESGAYLADVLGDSLAQKWHSDALKVIEIINEDFWRERDGYIYDRKLPNGEMLDSITTANPTIPLLWNYLEPAKAARAMHRMAQPDMTVEWGLRTNSNADSIYSSTGYHEGTGWALTTGWGSLAAFANGETQQGWKYLKANADLTKDFSLGYITEVLLGDERVIIINVGHGGIP
ncbi:MAG: GH116 family glycosyl hydrolase, partial [Armatimonadota bacterium]